jgi:hypothetical protein
VIQSFGFLVAALIQSPEKVRRNNGQAIALFKSKSCRYWEDIYSESKNPMIVSQDSASILLKQTFIKLLLTLPFLGKEELIGMPKAILTPSVLLMSLALFSCQMPLSLTGSLNAFYFNARTRSLANVGASCLNSRLES